MALDTETCDICRTWVPLIVQRYCPLTVEIIVGPSNFCSRGKTFCTRQRYRQAALCVVSKNRLVKDFTQVATVEVCIPLDVKVCINPFDCKRLGRPRSQLKVQILRHNVATFLYKQERPNTTSSLKILAAHGGFHAHAKNVCVIKIDNFLHELGHEFSNGYGAA